MPSSVASTSEGPGHPSSAATYFPSAAILLLPHTAISSCMAGGCCGELIGATILVVYTLACFHVVGRVVANYAGPQCDLICNTICDRFRVSSWG